LTSIVMRPLLIMLEVELMLKSPFPSAGPFEQVLTAQHKHSDIGCIHRGCGTVHELLN